MDSNSKKSFINKASYPLQGTGFVHFEVGSENKTRDIEMKDGRHMEYPFYTVENVVMSESSMLKDIRRKLRDTDNVKRGIGQAIGIRYDSVLLPIFNSNSNLVLTKDFEHDSMSSLHVFYNKDYEVDAITELGKIVVDSGYGLSMGCELFKKIIYFITKRMSNIIKMYFKKDINIDILSLDATRYINLINSIKTSEPHLYRYMDNWIERTICSFKDTTRETKDVFSKVFYKEAVYAITDWRSWTSRTPYGITSLTKLDDNNQECLLYRTLDNIYKQHAECYFRLYLYTTHFGILEHFDCYRTRHDEFMLHKKES